MSRHRLGRGRLNVLTADFYKPVPLSASTKLSEGSTVTLSASGVPIRVDNATDEVAPVPGIGRSPSDNLMTTDTVRIDWNVLDDSGNPIRPTDGWFFQIKSGAGEDDGTWYVILGDPILRSYRQNRRTYLCTRTNAPAID